MFPIIFHYFHRKYFRFHFHLHFNDLQFLSIPFIIIYYNWIKRQRFRGGYLYRECSKYQLIFLAAEEVLSKPFLSWLKKTASLFHSSTLRVFVFVGRRCFLFFYFFNWLSVHFRKYSDAQLTKGSGCQGMVCFSTASLRRRLHAFPHPLLPPSTRTTNQTWPIGSTIASL